MCGIIGLISKKPVCSDIVRGLRALEHRGIYSSGMISYDSKSCEFSSPIRSAGSSTNVFRGVKLPNDNVAIGHNRYATSGKANNRIKDIQPMYFARPGLALAHNGQVANYPSLKKRLKKHGYCPFTTNDSEAIMFALAENLKAKKFYEAQNSAEFVEEKLFPALSETMNPSSEFPVIGAYSVVAILADYGLLAFKDPNGIRPLTFAKKENEDSNLAQYGFISETSGFHTLKGFRDFYELEPGEAIFIDHDHNIYRKRINSQKLNFCPFEIVYFSQIDSDYRGQQVYDARKKLGRALAQYFSAFKDRIDMVMPIPKSPIPAAKTLATIWGKDYGGIVAQPSYSSSRAFQQPTTGSRESVVDEKFLFIRSHIKDKKIALVDDSVVRGDSSKAVIQKLFDLGARQVHLFSTYPPFKYICSGGIDVPEPEELAFHHRNVDGVRRYIRATSLNFLPVKLMLEAIGLTRQNACLGCTEGKYPFDMSDYKNFQVVRNNDRT